MTKIVNKLVAIPALITGVVIVTALFELWNARAMTVDRPKEVKPALESATSQPVAPGAAPSPIQKIPGREPVLPVAQALQIPAPMPSVVETAVAQAAIAPVAPKNLLMLDNRRQFALGMIETGNNDYEIGRLGEISRYQIMPSVWKRYSRSRSYQDPEVSLTVARKHWDSLYASFKKQANREPNDFDMYVLWNTTHGYYANRGFSPARLHPVVRERAKRFVNLVERGSQLAGL